MYMSCIHKTRLCMQHELKKKHLCGLMCSGRVNGFCSTCRTHVAHVSNISGDNTHSLIVQLRLGGWGRGQIGYEFSITVNKRCI